MNKYESRANKIIPHGKPEISDTNWWGSGPIFREVIDKFDLWTTQHWRSSFKSAWFEPSNHYTTAPLVINQAQLDWPRQEGCSCKWIEEHKQESINTQSEIADLNDMNIQMRIQELGSKGLIDTVEEINNGVLDHYKRICHDSYNEWFSFSMEN